MMEARQIDGLVQQLHADQPAACRQHQIADARPIVMRQVLRALGGIGARLQRLIGCADGKREARPEPVGRAHQVAEVQRLRDALGADPEVAAGQCGWLCFVHWRLVLIPALGV